MNTTNKKIILYTILLVLACLYYYLIHIKVIDGFSSDSSEVKSNSNAGSRSSWTTQLKDKFIKYQSTVFENNYQFDVNELAQVLMSSLSLPELLTTASSGKIIGSSDDDTTFTSANGT